MSRDGSTVGRFAIQLFRERLQILQVLATLQTGLTEPGVRSREHPAAAAAELYDHEEALSLREWLRQRLAEVDAALERIRNGTYGICEVCATPIPQARLRAIPWARTRVRCQKHLEEKDAARSRGPEALH